MWPLSQSLGPKVLEQQQQQQLDAVIYHHYHLCRSNARAVEIAASNNNEKEKGGQQLEKDGKDKREIGKMGINIHLLLSVCLCGARIESRNSRCASRSQQRCIR